MSQKIYTDDPLVFYKGTVISPLRTRAEIDSMLALYGIYETAWHWKPDANDIWIMFNITEQINGVPVKVAAKVECYILWDKANKNAKTPEKRVERPNLGVSMRWMFYYIKTHLQAAYTQGSSKVMAFLPNVTNFEGKTVEQEFLPKITSKESPYALTDQTQEWQKPDVKNIPQRNKLGEFDQ